MSDSTHKTAVKSKELASIYLQQVLKTGKIIRVFFPDDRFADRFCVWVPKYLPTIQVSNRGQGEATFISSDFDAMEILERKILSLNLDYSDL